MEDLYQEPRIDTQFLYVGDPVTGHVEPHLFGAGACDATGVHFVCVCVCVCACVRVRVCVCVSPKKGRGSPCITLDLTLFEFLFPSTQPTCALTRRR